MYIAGIFLLIITIIPIHRAQIVCDSTMCNNVCTLDGHMSSGTCVGNTCECSSGKKCSGLDDVVCVAVCKSAKLKGHCADGQCICRAELEPCGVNKCSAQCLNDPRARECILAGCVVIPLFCLKYGPTQTCGCLCQCPYAEINKQFTNIAGETNGRFAYFTGNSSTDDSSSIIFELKPEP